MSGFSWLQLADAGEYIPRLLESNVVWKPEAVGAVPRAGAVFHPDYDEATAVPVLARERDTWAAIEDVVDAILEAPAEKSLGDLVVAFRMWRRRRIVPQDESRGVERAEATGEKPDRHSRFVDDAAGLTRDDRGGSRRFHQSTAVRGSRRRYRRARNGSLKTRLLGRTSMKRMGIFCGAALAAGLALTGAVRAGGDLIVFPENYAKGVLYTTVDRADNKQYRELYSTPEAIEAVKAGKPIPSGTVLTLVQYKAKLMTAGQPEKDANGRFIKGPI